MSLRWKLFGVLSFFITVYVGGLLMFTRGFLLSRLVVDKNNTCHVDFASHTDSHGGDGCWMHKRFDKAIIIVIDALRFDFVTYNTSLSMSQALPYQNKLPIIHELLTTKPMNTRLYKFVADPPTTTLQRLKGLTTGSLPTFVDAGSNFASADIGEDNFIDQLVNLGRRVVMMGDDTWEGLFPGRFHRSYPFPSFNVKDLHTVDNGVIKNLMPEVKRSDWELLIGHFLGVDHCGHRFGPDHPAMAEKLNQMNNILRSLIKTIDDQTILFVFGDHGMTRTGDHGGDSPDEVDAALFIYSHSQITSSPPQNGAFSAISQVDLVPTLSLLLGAPIPHSNLGTVITDLFNHCPWWKTGNNKVKQVFHSVEALHLNAHQVLDYLKSYAEISHDFPRSRFTDAQSMFKQAESELNVLVTEVYNNLDSEKNVLQRLINLEKKYVAFLNQVKAECKEIWAKFDVNMMLLGVVLTMLVLIACAIIIVQLPNDLQGVPSVVYIVSAGLFWLIVYFAVITLLDMKMLIFLFALVFGVSVVILIVCVLLNIFTSQEEKSQAQTEENSYDFSESKTKPVTVGASVLLIMYCVSSFSNSYVVNEDASTSFLLQSAILMIFLEVYRTISSVASAQKKSRSATPSMVSPTVLMFLGTFAILMLVRLAQNFRACREEQWNCDISLFVLPLSGLVDDLAGYRNLRYFISVSSIVAITSLAYYWLKRNGNFMGFSLTILCVKYLLPLSTVAMCLSWALLGLPQHKFDNLPVWQQVMSPQIVYVCFILVLLCVICQPLLIHFLPNSKNVPGSLSTATQSFRSLYHHLKSNWRDHFQTAPEDRLPAVYGLGTVYSATMIVALVGCLHALCLLLGDGLAPGLILGSLGAAVLLELHAYYTVLYPGETLHVPTASIIAWFLLASHFFYGTGHQTTVPNIRWEAAFVGFHGHWNNNILPAIMMFSNTFSSQVLFTLCCPLLVIWPVSRKKAILSLHSQKSTDSPLQEMELQQRESELTVAMFKFSLTYMMFSAAKVFSSMCAAGLLRRHLMVWKIFAPRFVFDGASSIVTCLALLLSNLLIFRIQTCVKHWVTGLEKRAE